MNELECFRQTVNHKQHEGFLFHAGCTRDLDRRLKRYLGVDEKTGMEDYFGMFRPVNIDMKAPKDYKEKDFSGYYKDVEMPSGSFINGLGVLQIPGSMYHFTGYVSPLRNAESLKELEGFAYPSVDGYQTGHMKAEADELHAKGKTACCYITHMYEDAWQIRGYEPFLMDMALKPEMCEFILDRIMERNLKKAEAAAAAGVDLLYTGDDVANQRTLMFSKEMWRKFIKPRWAAVYEAARKIKKDIQLWYHSDGNIEEIIPELIEIGVTILNPIQPECMDPVKIKNLYGDRLVLDGTIGTQTTMPFGTADDVRKAVRDRKKSLGYDGALILAPTHILEPEVPLENILAFFDECRR